ncbi:hypothetical protein AB0B54_30230 [Microbispora bryophytorum]|uniref:hypothetical protein n=1 Tax=Microbispora bryophytorum TaxID=1460882 RepID=UPI0033C6A65A
MTIYVVPCGVSLLDALEDPASKRRPPRWKAKPFGDRRDDWTGKTLLASGHEHRIDDDQVIGSWTESGLADPMLCEWTSMVSAETHTLAKRTGLPMEPVAALRAVLDRNDRVVLLASDTGKGITAALCVAFVITGGDVRRMHFISTPSSEAEVATFAGRLHPRKVTVVRVTGLGPSDGGLRTAVAGIGRVLRCVYDLQERLEIHLTGGFKATLLHTLAMSEVVHSLSPATKTEGPNGGGPIDWTTAWYLFDDEDASPVQIGLRRFSTGSINNMRAELSAAARKKLPDRSCAFENIAWEVQGTEAVLNDFGVGYLAVLGPKDHRTNDGAP